MASSRREELDQALTMVRRTEPLGPAIKHSLAIALLSIVDAAQARIDSGEELRESEICARIVAEALILCAWIHSGSDQSFTDMADRAIRSVRYGMEN